MPRKYLMSWEGYPYFRWVKMFRGRRYRVSCDDLKAQRSKEESYLSANAWWQVQVMAMATLHLEQEQQAALDLVQRKIGYAANHAPELLANLEHIKTQILESSPDETVLDDADTINQNVEIFQMMTGVELPPDTDATTLQTYFGDRRIWQERLSKAKVTETNRTIGFQLERFLTEQRTQQKPQTHNELANYLTRSLATTVWTSQTSVETVNEETISRHYTWLCSLDCSAGTHNKWLGFFRRFVSWLYSERLFMELPRNLKLKSHRKKTIHKAIRKFANVKEVVEALEMPYKLWALLGLNCGMTQADWGFCNWNWIDTSNWTLTRRRVKIGDNPDAPTVCYRLWPCTIDALTQLSHRTGLLFTTENGKPMYETKFVDGKAKKKDMFSTQWNRLKQKPPIPLAKFRSIGSSVFKQSETYRSYADIFLANVAHNITDKHYAAEHDNPFFRALEFVRSELGL